MILVGLRSTKTVRWVHGRCNPSLFESSKEATDFSGFSEFAAFSEFSDIEIVSAAGHSPIPWRLNPNEFSYHWLLIIAIRRMNRKPLGFGLPYD